MKTTLELLGAGFIIVAAALIWLPLALLVAGVACLLAARPA